MNDDTVFDADFLAQAFEVMNNSLHSLLQAQIYSQQTGQLIDSGVHADWRRMTFEVTKDSALVNCFCTTALFLRLKDFITIGGFYPRLLPHFASDYEFTMRAHRQGFQLITDPSVRLSVNEQTTWNYSAN